MTVTEALWRPAVTLVVAALLPQLTARGLGWVFLRDLPPGGDERARRLQPFRRAAFLVGLGQLQLAWMAGVTALGPRLLERPEGPSAFLFGGACAVIAFLSGGLARRIEEPASRRSTALGVLRLRLRLIPWVAGPVAAGIGAAHLPLLRGPADAPGVAWPWVAAALAACALGVAYGGLLVSLLTTALRPAGRAVRELAGSVARAEGVAPPLVLRLPTPGVRFANAAALPWARTMVVADGAVELLSEEQLRAVLAHEAGHLSERPVVGIVRVGAAALVLFALTAGARVAAPWGPWASGGALAASVAVALVLFVAVRRLARRMEVRADRRAEQTVGAVPLAEALRKLHAYAQMPMSTGRRRIHPDLFDRLGALGLDMSPRPPPPPKGGMRLGALIAIAIVAVPAVLYELTDVRHDEVTEVSPRAAHSRLFVAPWDGEAVLALAWHDARAERTGPAERRGRLAARMGADEAAYWELWAELHAQAGDCDAARDAFDRSVRARAERDLERVLEEPLELGNYHLPPTYVRRCDRPAPGEGQLTSP